MKKSLLLFASLIFTLFTFGQVAVMQYRVVPNDREDEFVEKETKYWSQVAAAAIDNGDMTGWSLWRKVGVTTVDAPNYVFVNNFESLDKMDPSKVWTNDNVRKMGVSPDMVETNSFTTIWATYYMQVEDMIQGDYKYAIVNYAKPDDRSGFIEENKTLWKPLHEQNIKNGTNKMTSWGLLSVIYPLGNQGRFSCATWDGFNKMSDALKYLSYSSPDPEDANSPWQTVLSKSKMGEIMPNGFEHSIMYELVMRIAPENN